MDHSAWTSGFRSIVVAAGLCLAAALGVVAPTTPQAAEGDIWTLQDINLNSVGPGVHPSVTIASQRFDSMGGSIEFDLGGDNAHQSCPGGSERVRFSWRFQNDVFRLSEGSDVTVVVSGEKVSVAAPCGGALTDKSRVTASGTKGGSPTLPDQMLAVIDADRTFAVRDTIDERFAFGSNDGGARTSTTRYIHLDVYQAPADRPYAYFIVQFGLFGGGVMQVAYIYKHGQDTPMKPPVPGVSACGFTVAPEIHAKWLQIGGETGVLGCPQKAEDEAGRSPAGTTGRYVLFNGGVVIWHRDGPQAGKAFAVNGCIASLYQGMGGTNSWLGFPVSDEYDAPGGRRSDFEGGYVLWNAATGECMAYRSGGTALTVEPGVDMPGSDFANFDLQQDDFGLCRDACAAEKMCVAYTFVKPGVQGPAPRCWLKSAIPPAVASDCCVSGRRP